ncbi:MAG: hypothetical protein E6I86_12700 [Chloroflexi bacterium]|nr:MAG: hypothetical protein E6I86_12700 [Chloroflexota bacterium]
MLTSLLLKVVVAPVLITGATLAGRRWGDRLGGWLVGLPLTSGPVVFFLAIDQGSRFATTAALAVLLGTISQAAFAVAYARVAVRAGWPVATAAGCAVFALSTIGFQRLSLPALPAFALVTASLILATILMPKSRPGDRPVSASHWDIPLRIVVATGLVLLLTGIAPAIGAHLTGLLSPFPVYAGVLAIFAHRQSGDAAANVLAGLLLGLFSFAAFFVLLALGLNRIGIGLSFALATATALVIQGLTLRAIRGAGDSGLP